MAALGAEAAGRMVWLPLDAVVRTVHVPAGDILSSPEGDTLIFEEGAVPFLSLPRLLAEGPAPAVVRRAWSVIVIRHESGLAAVGVDRLGGLGQVVMRPLPRVIGTFPLLAGAVFDAEGVPQPVLDPAGLVAAVREARSAVAAPAEAPRPPILVIDDSLTTRMLEQSILESAGYQVDLAVSAEEGLLKARQRRYGLFLVDVEMPGMNGFEFVARTKGEPGLRDVPAILVTSLGSPEHRRRGMEVGAHAHIVKGEFDEGRLRRLIRDLMG
jgi:two-component system chemotaxis sensor kinase CheA